MEYHRKQAKALVHDFRAGEPTAVQRAEAVLGTRVDRRFLLSDAQHVIARERGYRTWPELKRTEASRREPTEGEDVVVGTDLVYAPGAPVEIVVRKRGWRFDISEGGRAVELAGRPEGWLAVAEQVVGEYLLNVNRRGVVFVQCNESRLEALVARAAEASVALYRSFSTAS